MDWGAERPLQQPQVAQQRLGLAWNSARRGALGPAIQTLRAGLLEFERIGRGHSGEVVNTTNNLAIVEAQAGQPLAAVASFERVLAMQGSDAVPQGRMNLAQYQFMVGRTKEAMAGGERARSAARANGDLFGVAMFDAAYVGCPAAVGRAHCRQRRETSRRVLEGLMPPSNTMFARLDLATGEEALAHGEVEAAHRALARSVAIFDASPRFQPTRTLAAAMLARTESALGRHGSAIARVDEAVRRARSLWSATSASGLPHSSWLGQALIAQAIVRKAAGQGDAARQSAEEALPHLQATMGDRAPDTRATVAFLASR